MNRGPPKAPTPRRTRRTAGGDAERVAVLEGSLSDALENLTGARVELAEARTETQAWCDIAESQSQRAELLEMAACDPSAHTEIALRDGPAGSGLRTPAHLPPFEGSQVLAPPSAPFSSLS